MIRSLSLMLAMLMLTMGAIYWIKWQPAEAQQHLSESIGTSVATGVSWSTDTSTQTIPVPQVESGSPTATPAETSQFSVAGHATSRLVDLNSATVNELESLPGIGAVLARRVVDHRTSVGRFLRVEDLREVKGIGSKKFDQIKSLVTVAGGEPKGKVEKRTS